MKYVLLIDELPEDSLPSESIGFHGFEQIDWHSAVPFDDRASISYDEDSIEKWKTGIRKLIWEVFPEKKISISVVQIKDHEGADQ